MQTTIRDLLTMKEKGEFITMLTAYDMVSARVSEMAAVPALLVGDSLGMVVQGRKSTIPVTLDQMIYHCEIVARVTEKPLIVADMPFMTYSVNHEQALTNSARMMQQTGVSAVKLEGGEVMEDTISRVVNAGIPVMGHVGFTPQSVNKLGVHVQGRDLEMAKQVIRDAEAVQDAGAFAVVLELMPAPLAKIITERLTIPTIGIGAGAGCDGQIQVFHDIMGMFFDFVPKHTRQYAEVGETMRDAVTQYVNDVKTGTFPTDENSFGMDDDIVAQLKSELNDSKLLSLAV
jgi:3-methyl-2-oxobutanoate hydroxymethyltransferase